MSDTKRILVASGGALVAAIALLVLFVLPAEYGFDPTGTGSALGLMGMSEEHDSPLHSQESRWQEDKIEFFLAPYEAVEYKYTMEAGATMLFEWQATSEVVYDMHAEPDGAAPGYAESFEQSRGKRAGGSYQAPFSGIHGWFWQNRGDKDVRVVLRSRGFYTGAVEMSDGLEFPYDMKPSQP